MVPLSDDGLIFCKPIYGPTFGNGHPDIWIEEGCNVNKSFVANFPNCYNVESGEKYVNGQASYTAFSGATNSYHCCLKEYEVYQVVYQ
jgi:hypothetical protein